MTKRRVMSCSNRSLARKMWGKLSRIAAQALIQLTERYGLSVADGDVSLIDGRWYVTHAGLLRLATRILQTSLLLSAVLRCAWPRPAPSIARFAKLTESACARSKSSDPSLRPHHLRIQSKRSLFLVTEMVRATASRDCGTSFAF